MTLQRRTLFCSAAALGLSSLTATSAYSAVAASASKPITVFHPFEPSPYDVLSRVINEELSKATKRPVLFEYGLMGRAAREVVQGPKDGSYLYFAALGPMVLKPNVP